MANDIGLYSYGFACLAYVLLGGALLLIWKNRSLTIAAIVTTVLTAGCAGPFEPRTCTQSSV
jgi:hypothetical protein